LRVLEVSPVFNFHLAGELIVELDIPLTKNGRPGTTAKKKGFPQSVEIGKSTETKSLPFNIDHNSRP
jgi:hypothetical protein